MQIRKVLFLIVFSILILLLNSGMTLATSANISVSGNEGAIPVSASASFTTYTRCDSQQPPNCTTHNSGTLYIYQDNSLIGQASGNGSASWSTTHYIDCGYFYEMEK